MVKYNNKIEELKEQGIFSEEQVEQLSRTLDNHISEEMEYHEEEESKPKPYVLIIPNL